MPAECVEKLECESGIGPEIRRGIVHRERYRGASGAMHADARRGTAQQIRKPGVRQFHPLEMEAGPGGRILRRYVVHREDLPAFAQELARDVAPEEARRTGD